MPDTPPATAHPASAAPYQPRRPATSQFLPLRHHRYHLRRWGGPAASAPPLVLLHGWMDVGASWQFVVDALRHDRPVVAPDWRGFGLTEGPPADHYVFADYLGDLDALLDHLAPGQPVDVVGHSMGGNIAMLYAGARPGRIRRLVNIEGFGLPPTTPDQAPARSAQWLDELRLAERGGMDLQAYPDADGVARRLMRNNPRLPEDKALWLARHWARPVAEADGSTRWRILGQPAHKVVSAQLYRADEANAHFDAITAPLLFIRAADDTLQRWGQRYTQADWQARLARVRDWREAHVPDAGHMLHHDQPQAVARLVEDFLLGGTPGQP